MAYRARRGDIIWLSLNPQSGHEQAGRRPALVISNDTFNDYTRSAAMVCPITNTDRGSELHVRLDERTSTTGVVMYDQAKILDIVSRNAEFIETAPEDIVFDAVDIVAGIIEFE